MAIPGYNTTCTAFFEQEICISLRDSQILHKFTEIVYRKYISAQHVELCQVLVKNQTVVPVTTKLQVENPTFKYKYMYIFFSIGSPF